MLIVVEFGSIAKIVEKRVVKRGEFTRREEEKSVAVVLSPKINLFSISSLIQFIFDRIEISSHIMKDIGMTNKFGVSNVLLFDKFEIFSFRWLR